MLYRVLGSTGLRVSVIGLGTWQFGGEWGRSFSQSEADAILDKAAEMGINLIDTAECYGDHLAEKFVGDYLRRRDRSRWVIATKFGHRFHGFVNRTEDFSPKGVREQLHRSLEALRVDCVDLYQFHSGSDAAFHNPELWTALRTERETGTIKHLGVSILGKGSERQAREAADVGVEALQVIYNRLDRRPEQTVFPYAQSRQLGILARVPLASGLLTGKYPIGSVFPAGDVRSTFDAAKMNADLAEAGRILREEVPAGTDAGQWALAWCLQNHLVSAVIPGCKDPGQVEKNAGAVGLLKTG